MKKNFVRYATVAILLFVAFTLRGPRNSGDYNTAEFSRLPVLVNGRLKPLDTVARTSLLMMQGRQHVTAANGEHLAPIEWLLDTMYGNPAADHYAIFEITHPDLLALLGLAVEQGAGNKRFSAAQFAGKLAELDRQAKLADDTERNLRTPFQRAVLQLRDSVALYQRLQGSVVAFGNSGFLDKLIALEQRLPVRGSAAAPADRNLADDEQLLELGRMFGTMDSFSYFRPIPPAAGAEPTAWRTVGATWIETLTSGKIEPAARAYARIGRAWRDHDAPAFNSAVQEYGKILEATLPTVVAKSNMEVRFNSAEPFYTSSVLYVFVFLGGVVSWLKWSEALRRIAFRVVWVAFGLATAGIGVRMWLEARPPVTNLYSSALFVGWGAVALCLVLEHFYKNAVGSVTAGIVGFATLVIAHHLALGGDTMEMMRAVLDSNFWLASHVVTIAVGYSATFLAGFLALIYIFRGVLSRSLDRGTAEALARMIYGIVCFATLFSFVGTILGGIWADQSWGRFWGWDPKENGALLIVIWNSIILHVRWAGLVRARGMAVLAVFGNIVTAWSWFGVNMLGVGLHSYGFMDSAFWWLVAFGISQILAILLASLPLERWRSPVGAR